MLHRPGPHLRPLTTTLATQLERLCKARNDKKLVVGGYMGDEILHSFFLAIFYNQDSMESKSFFFFVAHLVFGKFVSPRNLDSK